MSEVQNKVEFLFLNEEDLLNAGVLDMSKCVPVIEEMFKLIGEKDYLMGGPNENEHGIKIWFPNERRTNNMPVAGPDRRFMSLICYLGGKFNITGEKWYGSNSSNRDKGLPRSILTITLNDVETGQPIAYMSGNLISATRTGAVPGVAARYLSDKHADSLSIIGAGVISWASTLAILQTRKSIKQIKVYDISFDRAKEFCERIERELNILAIPTDTMESCIENSDIVSIATSGATQPKLSEAYLKEGALVLISGGAQVSDQLLLQSKIVTDNWEMHKSTANEWSEFYQHGNQNVSDDQYYGIAGQVYKLIKENKLEEKKVTNLGNVVLDNDIVKPNNKGNIIFYAGGMATEDIAWAYTLYQEAREKGLGKTLKLWDTPHWS